MDLLKLQCWVLGFLCVVLGVGSSAGQPGQEPNKPAAIQVKAPKAPGNVKYSTGRYRAQQIPGLVLVFAEGSHCQAGYVVFFERLPQTVDPPAFALWEAKPTGAFPNVQTPFSRSTMFVASDKVDRIIVFDDRGENEVQVEQLTAGVKPTGEGPCPVALHMGGDGPQPFIVTRVEGGDGPIPWITKLARKQHTVGQLLSRLEVELPGGKEVSFKDNEPVRLPVKLVFFNETDQEQRFKSTEYFFALLDKSGVQLKDALLVSPEDREVVLHGRSTPDDLSIFVNASALKSGEEYQFLCSVRGRVALGAQRTGLAKFVAKKVN